jgi:hypothetical protein
LQVVQSPGQVNLDGYEVTTETEALKELFIAVEPLSKRVAFVLKEA